MRRGLYREYLIMAPHGAKQIPGFSTSATAYLFRFIHVVRNLSCSIAENLLDELQQYIESTRSMSSRRCGNGQSFATDVAAITQTIFQQLFLFVFP